jgi:hypothetical protein
MAQEEATAICIARRERPTGKNGAARTKFVTLTQWDQYVAADILADCCEFDADQCQSTGSAANAA